MNIDDKIAKALGIGRENYDDQTRVAALVELVKEVHTFYEAGIDASEETFIELEGETRDAIDKHLLDLRSAFALVGLLTTERLEAKQSLQAARSSVLTASDVRRARDLMAQQEEE